MPDPVLAINDGLQVTLFGECFNQRITLDLTYRVQAIAMAFPSYVDTMEQVLDIVLGGAAASIKTNYLDCLPPQYNLIKARSQIVGSQRYVMVERLVGTPGTWTGAATVAADAFAVTRRTLLAGRDQVSTLKVGPAPDNGSAAGIPIAGMKINLAAFAASTLEDITTAGTAVNFRPCILNAARVGTGRDLKTYVVGGTSRVNQRRVVGRGE